ncbi:MAG: hypothetical protein WDO73_03065 [Ignavibacteriota bacterium]
MWIRSQRARKSTCPECQSELTGVTAASPNQKNLDPYAGAPTICCYCGALLVFDAQLMVRQPTPELAARLLEQYPACTKNSGGYYCRDVFKPCEQREPDQTKWMNVPEPKRSLIRDSHGRNT